MMKAEVIKKNVAELEHLIVIMQQMIEVDADEKSKEYHLLQLEALKRKLRSKKEEEK